MFPARRVMEAEEDVYDHFYALNPDEQRRRIAWVLSPHAEQLMEIAPSQMEAVLLFAELEPYVAESIVADIRSTEGTVLRTLRRELSVRAKEDRDAAVNAVQRDCEAKLQLEYEKYIEIDKRLTKATAEHGAAVGAVKRECEASLAQERQKYVEIEKVKDDAHAKILAEATRTITADIKNMLQESEQATRARSAVPVYKGQDGETMVKDVFDGRRGAIGRMESTAKQPLQADFRWYMGKIHELQVVVEVKNKDTVSQTDLSKFHEAVQRAEIRGGVFISLKSRIPGFAYNFEIAPWCGKPAVYCFVDPKQPVDCRMFLDDVFSFCFTYFQTGAAHGIDESAEQLSRLFQQVCLRHTTEEKELRFLELRREDAEKQVRSFKQEIERKRKAMDTNKELNDTILDIIKRPKCA